MTTRTWKSILSLGPVGVALAGLILLAGPAAGQEEVGPLDQCTGAYMVPAPDGSGCVLQCDATTVPSESGETCVCAPGLAVAGYLPDLRLICRPPSDRPAGTSASYIQHIVSGEAFLAEAARAGFGLALSGLGGPYQSCAAIGQARFVATQAISIESGAAGQIGCQITLLTGRALAPDWRVSALRVVAPGDASITADGALVRSLPNGQHEIAASGNLPIVFTVSGPAANQGRAYAAEVAQIVLIGPPGERDWTAALP
jgi:hypothetical protein